MDPAQLLEAIRTGDESAKDTLYQQFRERYVRLIQSRLRDEPDVVEDLLHDAFVDVYTAVLGSKLRDETKLWSFAWLIVQRKIWARFKKSNLVPLDYDSGVSGGQYRRVIEGEVWERVRTLLSHLSPLRREIVQRFYIGGEPAADIQAELELSHTAFRLHKSRALAELAHLAKAETRRAEVISLSRRCRPFGQEMRMAA